MPLSIFYEILWLPHYDIVLYFLKVISLNNKFLKITDKYVNRK